VGAWVLLEVQPAGEEVRKSGRATTPNARHTELFGLTQVDNWSCLSRGESCRVLWFSGGASCDNRHMFLFLFFSESNVCYSFFQANWLDNHAFLSPTDLLLLTVRKRRLTTTGQQQHRRLQGRYFVENEKRT